MTTHLLGWIPGNGVLRVGRPGLRILAEDADVEKWAIQESKDFIEIWANVHVIN